MQGGMETHQIQNGMDDNKGTKKKTRGSMMKVTVMGPPGSGKTTVLQLLCKHYGLTPIKTGEIVVGHALPSLQPPCPRDLSGGDMRMAEKSQQQQAELTGYHRLTEEEAQQAVGQKLKQFFYHKKDRSQRPPVELVIPLIAEHVRDVEAHNARGWVMERGIREPGHYEAFKEAGILPDRVIVLEADPETVNKRIANRRVDRTTDRVYSVNEAAPGSLLAEDHKVLSRLQRRKHDNPTDTARRTSKYHSEAERVVPLYGEDTARRFNADRPIAEVFAEITQWLDECYRIDGVTRAEAADELPGALLSIA